LGNNRIRERMTMLELPAMIKKYYGRKDGQEDEFKFLVPNGKILYFILNGERGCVVPQENGKFIVKYPAISEVVWKVEHI